MKSRGEMLARCSHAERVYSARSLVTHLKLDSILIQVALRLLQAPHSCITFRAPLGSFCSYPNALMTTGPFIGRAKLFFYTGPLVSIIRVMQWVTWIPSKPVRFFHFRFSPHNRCVEVDFSSPMSQQGVES
mmetsp:Transcript_8066/g.16242  ORF Transcript_8066/g.16242 Transcript_8066/m.16242 type:complete len:131 (+) Transcript_8066:156-548(+)